MVIVWNWAQAVNLNYPSTPDLIRSPPYLDSKAWVDEWASEQVWGDD